jgi:hypothetical protein
MSGRWRLPSADVPTPARSDEPLRAPAGGRYAGGSLPRGNANRRYAGPMITAHRVGLTLREIADAADHRRLPALPRARLISDWVAPINFLFLAIAPLHRCR